MAKKKDDPFREEHAHDDLITDEALFTDAKWKIGRNLEHLKDKTLPNDMLMSCFLLPNSFEFSIKKKLHRSGIETKYYLLSDLWGSAQGEDVKGDVKAGLLALHEIAQLEQLLVKDGIIDREAATIYFHALRLFLNLFRAGTLAETVQREEKRLEAYKAGPGALSKETGEGNRDRARQVLEKRCGGIDGYYTLARGEKGRIREEIEKTCTLKDSRHVYNILREIKKGK